MKPRVLLTLSAAVLVLVAAGCDPHPTSVSESESVVPEMAMDAGESWVITTYYWKDDGWVQHASWDGSDLGTDLHIGFDAWNWEPEYSAFWASFDNAYLYGDTDLPQGLIDDFDDGVIDPIWGGGQGGCQPGGGAEACEAGGVVTVDIAEGPAWPGQARVAGLSTDLVVHGEFDVQIDFSVNPEFHETDNTNLKLTMRDEQGRFPEISLRNGHYGSHEVGQDYNYTYRDTDTDDLSGKLRITRTRGLGTQCRVVVVNARIPVENPGCTSPTIQGGIDKVQPGGTVRILNGTYPEAVHVYKGVTLETMGPGPVVLPLENEYWGGIVVTTTEPVVINDLEVEAYAGYGIRGQGPVDLTLDGVTVRHSRYGVYVENAEWRTGARARLVVRNSSFDGGPESAMATGVFAVTDVDALLQANVVRRTNFSCLQLQGTANVTAVGNDVDECGPAGGIRAPMRGGTVVNIIGNTVRNSGASNSRFGVFFARSATPDPSLAPPRGCIENNTVIDYVKAYAPGDPAGIYLRGDVMAAVRANDIAGNALAGLAAWTDETVDASNNWWGSADGPSGDGPGSGDAVSGNAVYLPFAAAPVANTNAEACSGAF